MPGWRAGRAFHFHLGKGSPACNLHLACLPAPPKVPSPNCSCPGEWQLSGAAALRDEALSLAGLVGMRVPSMKDDVGTSHRLPGRCSKLL